MKEKLIDLIKSAPKLEFHSGSRAQGRTYQTAQNLAEHLLANGVVVIDTDAVSAKNRPLISHFFGHPITERKGINECADETDTERENT